MQWRLNDQLLLKFGSGSSLVRYQSRTFRTDIQSSQSEPTLTVNETRTQITLYTVQRMRRVDRFAGLQTHCEVLYEPTIRGAKTRTSL